MERLTFDELVGSLPGAEDEIKSGAINPQQIMDAAEMFGASRGDEYASKLNNELGIRIPGTRVTIRVGAASLGLLRLAWSGYRTAEGHGDLGDALNFGSAANQIMNAVRLLTVESGELCVYLALESASSISNLLTREYPKTTAITEVLKMKGGDWCLESCPFHKPAHSPLRAEQVEMVLNSLEANGVIKRQSSDGWWIKLA